MDFTFPAPKRTGTTKHKSTIQEKKVAKEFNGKVTPGSGALSIKGDVSTDKFLIECKTTAKTQYILKLDTLRTITKQADAVRKIPLVLVDLDDEAKGFNRSWVLLPKQDFLELMGE